MLIEPMTPPQAELALRAMRSLAASDGGMSDEERSLLAASYEILGVQGDLSAGKPAESSPSTPPTPAEAALVFPDEASRLRLLQMLLVMATIDNDFCAEELSIVDGYASALGVSIEWVAHMRKVATGHLMLMRLDMARRVPPSSVSIHETFSEQPLNGAWDFLRGVVDTAESSGAARVTEDLETSWRYKRLGLLPRGTLGRAYWAYMTSRRFLLPGERGSFSGTTYHDFLHALCGYDTDPAGEAEVTAFTAGMLKLGDPLALILGSMGMLLLSWTLSSDAPPPSIKLDNDRIQRAFLRGASATAELTEQWDYWSVVAQPIEELGRRYRLDPA
jgi:hypothetical protein